jgi:hypothetical protein
MELPRLLKHRRRKIDAEHCGAAFSCRCRDIPRTGGNIEEFCAALYSNCVQERSNRLDRQGAKSLMIVFRNSFPSGMFELTKRSRFGCHKSLD